jgi:uncharacterized protein (TIGR03083 family)
MVDLACAYRGVRTRLADLLAAVADGELERPAPATPRWTVHDNVAHLAGVAGDIVAGNLAGVTSDEWTAAQVRRGRDRSVGDLFDGWAADGAIVEPLIEQFGRSGHQLVADAATHEHDIRGGLGLPGARDSDAVDVGFHFLGSALGTSLDAAGAPAVAARHERGVTTFGTGEPAITVRISRFEFLRAVTGRRSLEQIAAYEWDGVVEPATLVLGLFTPRRTPLVE